MAVFWCDLILLPENTNSGTRRRIEIFQKRKMFRIEFPLILAWLQTPKTVSRPSRPSTLSSQTCCGTRRTIEFFKRRKMFGIELPKVLPLFQTPLTVSRLSRPWDCPALLPLEVDVQLRFPKEGKCFELNFSLSTSESLIEFFKRRKMFELPKVLPWFQTSRMFPDRPDGGVGPFTYLKKTVDVGGGKGSNYIL